MKPSQDLHRYLLQICISIFFNEYLCKFVTKFKIEMRDQIIAQRNFSIEKDMSMPMCVVHFLN